MSLLQRVASAYEDPVRRAKLVYWAYMLSTAMLVLGFLVILVRLFLD